MAGAEFVLPFPVTVQQRLMPYAALRSPAASGTFEIDLLADSTSILDSPITIDAGQTWSGTAASQPSIVVKQLVFPAGTVFEAEVTDDASGDALGLSVFVPCLRWLT